MRDRLELVVAWVGSHRQVAGQAVERLFPVHLLTREQEKSLWLHRALVSYLLVDPDRILTEAGEQVARWRRIHRADGMTERWLTAWEKVLAAGVEDVVEVLTSRSAEAVELRVNSPLAGVLPDDVRRAVLVSFARHWRQQTRAA